MKKALLGLTILLLVSVVWAQESEDFDITVTVNYIEFSLKDAGDAGLYGIWGIGNLDPGETAEMTTTSSGNHIYVNNSSNVALNFKGYSESVLPTCSFGTPTLWHPGLNAGINVYKLQLGKGAVSAVPVPSDYHVMDSELLSGADMIYSTIAGESFHLYAKLISPIEVYDGCEHRITVYIVAMTP